MSYESYAAFLRNITDEKLTAEFSKNYTNMTNSNSDRAAAAWGRMYELSRTEVYRRANT